MVFVFLLSACSGREEIQEPNVSPGNPQRYALDFSPELPLEEGMTRAADKTAFVNCDSIRIWGMATVGAYQNFFVPNFFNHETLTLDSGVWYYKKQPVYYWPQQTDSLLTFFALYQRNIENASGTEVTYEKVYDFPLSEGTELSWSLDVDIDPDDPIDPPYGYFGSLEFFGDTESYDEKDIDNTSGDTESYDEKNIDNTSGDTESYDEKDIDNTSGQTESYEEEYIDDKGSAGTFFTSKRNASAGGNLAIQFEVFGCSNCQEDLLWSSIVDARFDDPNGAYQNGVKENPNIEIIGKVPLHFAHVLSCVALKIRKGIELGDSIVKVVNIGIEDLFYKGKYQFGHYIGRGTWTPEKKTRTFIFLANGDQELTKTYQPVGEQQFLMPQILKRDNENEYAKVPLCLTVEYLVGTTEQTMQKKAVKFPLISDASESIYWIQDRKYNYNITIR